MDRRTFLKTACGFAAYSLLGPSPAQQVQRVLPRSDDSFLDDMTHRTFRYFWEQSDPHTGLSRERVTGARWQGERDHVGSIPATGFGLTAFCIGAKRKWIGTEQAQARVRNCLEFFAYHAPH